MVRLFVRHKVNEYVVWRKAYDGFESARIKLGAKGHAVYRDIEDGNDVTACTILTTSSQPRHSPPRMN